MIEYTSIKGYPATIYLSLLWHGAYISITFKHKKREILSFSIDWYSELNKCEDCRIVNHPNYTVIHFTINTEEFPTESHAITYCKSLIREIKKI